MPAVGAQYAAVLYQADAKKLDRVIARLDATVDSRTSTDHLPAAKAATGCAPHSSAAPDRARGVRYGLGLVRRCRALAPRSTDGYSI